VLLPADDFSNIFLNGKNNYQIFQITVFWYSVFLLAPLLTDSFQIHDFYLNTYRSIKTI